MMPEFKVGDYVKVKEDLVVNWKYYNEDGETYEYFVSKMAKYKGKIFKVVSIISNKYLLDTDWPYLFVDEMLEPVNDGIVFVAEQEEMINDYVAHPEVEAFIKHMEKIGKQQLIDYALDTKNEELFRKLTTNKS